MLNNTFIKLQIVEYIIIELPENIGFVFPQLQELNLSRNHFEGPIPTLIGHLREIGILDLICHTITLGNGQEDCLVIADPLHFCLVI